MRNRTLSHQQLLYKEARVSLHGLEQDKLNREEAGYRGEVLFDCELERLVQDNDLIHIKNLLFEYDDGKESQIDNVVIANDIVWIFEIKFLNFDLVIDAKDNWKFVDGQVMSKSPAAQALSQKFILQQLFKKVNVPLSVESFAVFMNPAQMIYGLYPGTHVLMSFQLDKQLPLMLKQNSYDYSKFAEMIESRRKQVSMYYKPLDFDIDKMKRGVVCDTCFKFIEKLSSRNLMCRNCNKKVSIKEAVGMIFAELHAYNPDHKTTSHKISELSGGILTSSTIRKNKYLKEL